MGHSGTEKASEASNSSRSTITQRESKFKIVDNVRSPLIPNMAMRGLSWQLAILFVMGEVLGGGVVAISNGLVNSGWYGIGIIAISLFANIYMGKIYSAAMVHITYINSNLLFSRTPFNAIIEFTLCRKAKIFSVILLNAFSLCVSTIYLLISAELMSIVVSDLYPGFNIKTEFRLLLLIFSIFLIPISWLGTPKEYWGVALMATLSTVFAAVILVCILWIDSPENLSGMRQRNVTFETFFSGFGTIFFAFCGIPFFPNIQSDMQRQEDFPRAIYYGYMLIALVYIPVAVTGFLVLGDRVKGNIVYNIFTVHISTSGDSYLTRKILCYIILLLFAGHFIFAYNLVFNTSAQEAEEHLRIPRGFSWKRCLLRTALVLVTLILAEAIPDFSIILSLVGGTIQVVLSFILPVLAYYKLNTGLHWYTTTGMCLCFFIACVGIVGTIYSGVKNIIRIYS